MKDYTVVANWKLHGTHTQAAALTQALKGLVKRRLDHVNIILAPPFTALDTVQRLIKNRPFGLAAQNVFWEETGAFTGEVSPPMLLEAGCGHVLLGHSERRRLFHETNQDIHRKLQSCIGSALAPILCIGETLRERREHQTRQVLSRQLHAALKGVAKNANRSLAVAYEPVWAIGTGKKASTDQINEAHGWIRRTLDRRFGTGISKQVPLLYGGSVNAANANELAQIPEVDGALVGGASLDPKSFVAIIDAFEEQGRLSK